jgi:hypothetical protein
VNLDLRLYTELERELGDIVEKHATELVLGRATDYADYRYRVGQLKGLREALAIASEANKRVIGVEDKDR